MWVFVVYTAYNYCVGVDLSIYQSETTTQTQMTNLGDVIVYKEISNGYGYNYSARITVKDGVITSCIIVSAFSILITLE